MSPRRSDATEPRKSAPPPAAPAASAAGRAAAGRALGDDRREADPPIVRPDESSEIRSPRAATAARLRTARELAGLSQGQVARLMGLHRPSISEAEAGRRRVSAEELAQFATHYGVSADWLSGAEPNTLDPADARVQLAARELSKLKADDLDRVLQLLAALRPSGV